MQSPLFKSPASTVTVSKPINPYKLIISSSIKIYLLPIISFILISLLLFLQQSLSSFNLTLQLVTLFDGLNEQDTSFSNCSKIILN